MNAPITGDTTYHSLAAEALLAAMRGEDFEPRLAQVEAFFQANAGSDVAEFFMIEPTDRDLTIGQVAELVARDDVPHFIDTMFRKQFTAPSAHERQAIAAIGAEALERMARVLVANMQFSYGDASLIEGQDVNAMPRTPVRKSGPR